VGTAFRREIGESGQGEASQGTQHRKCHSGADQPADLHGRQWLAEDVRPPAGNGSGQRLVCWLSHGLFSLSGSEGTQLNPSGLTGKAESCLGMAGKENGRRAKRQAWL
jgi:hypothetical protein